MTPDNMVENRRFPGGPPVCKKCRVYRTTRETSVQTTYYPSEAVLLDLMFDLGDRIAQCTHAPDRAVLKERLLSARDYYDKLVKSKRPTGGKDVDDE